MTKENTGDKRDGIGFDCYLTIDDPSSLLIGQMLHAPLPAKIKLKSMTADFMDAKGKIESITTSSQKQYEKVVDETWSSLTEKGYEPFKLWLLISENKKGKTPVQTHRTEISLQDKVLTLRVDESDKTLGKESKKILMSWFKQFGEFKAKGKEEHPYFYTVKMPHQRGNLTSLGEIVQ
jgi:hypothetical protein